MRTILLALFIIGLVGHALTGDAADSVTNNDTATKQDKSAHKLKSLEYPGSISLRSNSTKGIAQTIRASKDSLEEVAKWYHKKFSIDEAYWDGIADIPWPSGVKVTEAKGQQQWAIFRDDIRPSIDGSENKIVRDGTTRSFVVRTPEHTLFVTLNRTPADQTTLISVVYLNDDNPKGGSAK
jgi:hypothetical protein